MIYKYVTTLKIKNERLKGIVFAGTTAFLWGFLAIALKVAVNHVEAITVAWFRFAFAFIALFTILFWTRRETVKLMTSPPLLALVAGIGLGFNYVGYIKGLDLTTPSSAQIIIQLAPIMLAVVGLVVFKEKLSRVQSLGFILALTGFYLFYKDKLGFSLLDGQQSFNTGVLLVIFSAASWVVYAAIQKVLVKKFHAQSLNLIIYLVPALMLIPFITIGDLMAMSPWVWALMIFLGLNTVVAYGALAEAFKYLEANKVGIIITLNPMITIATMLILTSFEVSWIAPEHISLRGIIGAGLVVTGAVLAVRSKK